MHASAGMWGLSTDIVLFLYAFAEMLLKELRHQFVIATECAADAHSTHMVGPQHLRDYFAKMFLSHYQTMSRRHGYVSHYVIETSFSEAEHPSHLRRYKALKSFI
jgi:hypothetical protein